jgi:hypothetical protein
MCGAGLGVGVVPVPQMHPRPREIIIAKSCGLVMLRNHTQSIEIAINFHFYFSKYGSMLCITHQVGPHLAQHECRFGTCRGVCVRTRHKDLGLIAVAKYDHRTGRREIAVHHQLPLPIVSEQPNDQRSAHRLDQFLVAKRYGTRAGAEV